MKYKILSSGILVTCDGSQHVYYDNLPSQLGSALCWCHNAEQEQLARWSCSEQEARILRVSGTMEATD